MSYSLNLKNTGLLFCVSAFSMSLFLIIHFLCKLQIHNYYARSLKENYFLIIGSLRNPIIKMWRPVSKDLVYPMNPTWILFLVLSLGQQFKAQITQFFWVETYSFFHSPKIILILIRLNQFLLSTFAAK